MKLISEVVEVQIRRYKLLRSAFLVAVIKTPMDGISEKQQQQKLAQFIKRNIFAHL